jgi:hypothetical protein
VRDLTLFSVFFFAFVFPGFRAPEMKFLSIHDIAYVELYRYICFFKKKDYLLCFLECAAFYFSVLVLAARGIFFAIFLPLCAFDSQCFNRTFRTF